LYEELSSEEASFVFGAFVTLLREGFEATLLVAIVLAYLVKIGRREDFRQVWYGVGAAVAVSLAVAAALFMTAGGLEGIETALFIFGITQTSTPLQVALGAALGITAAVALGYAVYAGGKRINLGTFFKVTGVVLILVAAGLLAHGVAEFQEAGLLPEVVPLWDVSGAPVIGEESLVSELLTAFFGWDPEANLLELIAWATYLLAVGYTFLRPQPLPEGVASPAARKS
jgi:high-affinity iron transporter